MGPGIKEHPFFKDCSKKIEQMCRKALKEKYQQYEDQDLTLDNFIDDCHYRLLGELERMNERGFFYDVYLYKTIFDYAVSRNCPIDLCGDIDDSYIAYLMGMTKADPFQWLLPSPMPFKLLPDGRANMYIVTYGDFKSELTEYFKGIFGRENVTEIEDYIILGKTEDIAEGNSSKTIWIHIY